MAVMTGAEVVANFLKKNKISHVFDVAGGMIAYLEDAISRTPEIQCLPSRHEQASGFAAEGYARISKNFGVATATSGPGATNLITAIGSCFFDSVPTMYITGQVNTKDIKKNANIRQNGFQETDIVSVVKTLTKYAKQVLKVGDVLYELEKAHFFMKSGRPGPVLLDIPIDLQRTSLEISKFRKFYGSPEHKKLLKKSVEPGLKNKIKKLEKLIKESSAPVILIGGGIQISNTQKELENFVKRNNLPVVSSLMGLDSFPGSSDDFVGFIGSYGNREANIVFANADLIISLGSRLDVRQIGNPALFATHAKVVQVDIDPYSINNIVKSHLSFGMDLRSFFNLAKNLRANPKNAWRFFIRRVKENFSKKSVKSKQIDPNTFISKLSAVSGRDVSVVSDVGNHQMWLAQSWKTKPGQRLLFSGGMGSMGFALPAAIGAHFADTNKTVVVLCGDGGFQMNIQELETVRHQKVPLKIFILNNQSLGMVKDFQTTYLKSNFQSTVIGYSNPSFRKIASAYELDYVSIDSGLKEIEFSKILNSKKAVLVEVKIPFNTTLEPKVTFGNALDNQYPFLSEEKMKLLRAIKAEFEVTKKSA
ncbi:MAG: thiamine pyrophosphate-binding protein [Patescibacteria group bacterium]|jgi:acetolactate synthase-1/2/3 large subunit